MQTLSAGFKKTSEELSDSEDMGVMQIQASNTTQAKCKSINEMKGSNCLSCDTYMGKIHNISSRAEQPHTRFVDFGTSCSFS